MEKAIGNDLLLVGGGIGLAPLRSVALSHSNARKILLCYGARIPQLLMYMDEFPNWNADGVEVELTVDKPAEGWNGNVGVVTKLLEKHDFDPERTVVFVCGPSIMMKFCVRTLLSKGINGQNIFVSLESKMRCGIGKCGHCHFGSKHVCVDGPVFSLKDALDSSNELISV
jgi:NAD(P)H-flavin reductase